MSVDEGGHWYDPLTGNLYGPVATKSATAKNPTRPFSLLDARKVSAAPSVTTILQLLDKPGLRAWIRNRDIETALRHPAFVMVENKIEAVKEESDKYVQWASEFGTNVHAGISCALNGEVWWPPAMDDPDDSRMLKLVVDGFWAWYKDCGLKITRSEHAFFSPLGWAGTIDGEGDDFIEDVKTQDFSTPAEANSYLEHPLQLSGYALGTDQVDKDRYSIIVSRSTPGLVVLKKWKRDDNARYDKAWLALWELWKALKNYEPGGTEWLTILQSRGKLPQSLASQSR